MSRFEIVAIDKVRSKHYRAAADDYLARLAHFTKVRERELKRGRGKQSPIDISRDETDRLLEAHDPSRYLIVLDERGDLVTSKQLADRIQRKLRNLGRDATLIIGGANGLAKRARDQADWVWSLSTLTLPHELVRVIVAEQLYRAHSILTGGKYHKD